MKDEDLCMCLQWVRWKNIEWRIKRHFPKLHHHIFARFSPFDKLIQSRFWHCFCDVGSFWVQFSPDTVQRNGLHSPNNFCFGQRLNGKTSTNLHCRCHITQMSKRVNEAGEWIVFHHNVELQSLLYSTRKGKSEFKPPSTFAICPPNGKASCKFKCHAPGLCLASLCACQVL